MQFSLRQLLVFMALAGLWFALIRLPFALGASVVTLAIVGSHFFLPLSVWRHVVYGALLGITLLMCCMFLVIYLTVDAAFIARNSSAWQIREKTLPFIMPLGSLLGGTAGLVLWKFRSRGSPK